MAAGLVHLAGERLVDDLLLPLDVLRQIILEAAREAEDRLRRDIRAGDEIWRHWQRTALKAEDSMVAEAIQGVVPQAEELGVEMIVLSTDLSGIRVNRILEEMAQAEAADD